MERFPKLVTIEYMWSMGWLRVDQPKFKCHRYRSEFKINTTRWEERQEFDYPPIIANAISRLLEGFQCVYTHPAAKFNASRPPAFTFKPTRGNKDTRPVPTSIHRECSNKAYGELDDSKVSDNPLGVYGVAVSSGESVVDSAKDRLQNATIEEDSKTQKEIEEPPRYSGFLRTINTLFSTPGFNRPRRQRQPAFVRDIKVDSMPGSAQNCTGEPGQHYTSTPDSASLWDEYRKIKYRAVLPLAEEEMKWWEDWADVVKFMRGMEVKWTREGEHHTKSFEGTVGRYWEEHL